MNYLFIIKKTIAVCLLLFAVVISINGQSVSLPSVENTPEILSSVFRKNDILDVDLHTGRATVDIPIYTYKDQDFELPIKLHYSSGGYRPNEPIGFVGIGWGLNCGGTITRKINGGSDEGPGMLYNGLFGYYLSHKILKRPIDYDKILNEGECSITDWKRQFGYNLAETTPDEFTFNFMGYKGTFYLGPDTIYNSSLSFELTLMPQSLQISPPLPIAFDLFPGSV